MRRDNQNGVCFELGEVVTEEDCFDVSVGHVVVLVDVGLASGEVAGGIVC